MKFLCCLFLIIVSLFHSSVVSAAQACVGPSYQAFDFWLGHWTVTTPDGKKAGTNRIKKVYDGCVITEHYSNTSGPYGSSINMYDSTTGKWYQTWGDKTGLRLQLEGQLTNGSMIMSGATLNDDGQTVLHQIAWTPNDDGTVTQHWQVKSPSTSGWQTLFKGTYTKEE
ncbi:hypothetical protein [Alteromonas halophila]|nr:hypothetical protein [Alteromonas halophila]